MDTWEEVAFCTSIWKEKLQKLLNYFTVVLGKVQPTTSKGKVLYILVLAMINLNLSLGESELVWLKKKNIFGFIKVIIKTKTWC